jgi:hypothetical protein
MIYPLSKLEKPPHFPILSHDCQPTQSLMYWHKLYWVQTNGRTFSVANWSSFNVAETNSIPQFLSVSIILSTPVYSLIKNLFCSNMLLAAGIYTQLANYHLHGIIMLWFIQLTNTLGHDNGIKMQRKTISLDKKKSIYYGTLTHTWGLGLPWWNYFNDQYQVCIQ